MTTLGRQRRRGRLRARKRREGGEGRCEVFSNTSHLSHIRDSYPFTDYILFYTLGTGCFILRTITCQTKLQASGFQLV